MAENNQNTETVNKQEIKDFNFKPFEILSDKNGKYTNEPILLSIANHLYIVNGFGGGSGEGISGSSPFNSPQDFLNKINWTACEKYSAGSYRNYRNSVLSRTIKTVPSDFLSKAKSYSQKSGVPVGVIVAAGQSESNFKNCPKNKYGYGGYFGSKRGPEGSFDEQADTVKMSYNNAKNNSPGADDLALTVLMYITHHLPAVGSKYWKQTSGKIWSTDPDYIISNATACYPALGSKAVTRAEHLLINLSAQYMALQIREKSF